MVVWFDESSMCYPPAPSWVTDDVSEGKKLVGRKKLINAAVPVGPDVCTLCSAGSLGCLLLSVSSGMRSPALASDAGTLSSSMRRTSNRFPVFPPTTLNTREGNCGH